MHCMFVDFSIDGFCFVSLWRSELFVEGVGDVFVVVKRFVKGDRYVFGRLSAFVVECVYCSPELCGVLFV